MLTAFSINSMGWSRGSQDGEESPLDAAGATWDEDGWVVAAPLPLAASPVAAFETLRF
ncbi:hypothetical protein A2U01_0080152, partial [Trifolium medium]|nr:hypothetical protein [Trifolium medium]